VPATAITGPLTVITPAGMASSPTAFVITPPPPPVISNFTPGSGPAGTNVTITGTNFAGASAVLFNGVPSASYSIMGTTQITALVPPTATTGAITVVTSGGPGSSAMPFVVFTAPEITMQPFSQTVPFGSPVSFTFLSTGNPTADYQWSKDGLPLTGNLTAQTSTLQLASVTMADAGLYSCVASNAAGSANSTIVTLTVTKAPASIALSGLNTVFDTTPKAVVATTVPAGLPVEITYNGSATAPTQAGDYAVLATINDLNYAGSTVATLKIAPATATIALSKLRQFYDGAAKPVTATSSPNGLGIAITYDGVMDAPTLPGSFVVNASISDPNYRGTASGVLMIDTTALVRTASKLNGGLDGSIQVTTADAIKLNGNAWISGDLLLPGTPDIRENGHPTYGGTLDAAGGESPTNYSVMLNGEVVLRHAVRRVNPRVLPTAVMPPLPTGTRNVRINSPGQSVGDFATVRDLTLDNNAGTVVVPPGTYGEFTINGSGVLVLGVSGAISPAVYSLQKLTLTNGAELRIVGPVALSVAGDVALNDATASAIQPEWLVLNVASGDVTLNGDAMLFGDVLAPNGSITINSGTLTGTVIAGDLKIENNGLLETPSL
jgi:hypothetical protein